MVDAASSADPAAMAAEGLLVERGGHVF